MDQTFDRAIEVLRANICDKGLKASSAYYNQVWARDSFISFLGANMLVDEALLRCAKATILTFAKSASPLGQIANFYDLSTSRPEFGYSGSTDSSSLYIVGLCSLFHATEDRDLLGRPLEAAVRAYKWLRYQDANNTWLMDSPQGADWMDAAVQRTGKTLYNNALFLTATRSIEDLLRASGATLEDDYALDYSELKQRFTDVFLPDETSHERISAFWPRLATSFREGMHPGFAGDYFLHYISFARIDRRLDTLSNLLCILSALADAKTSLSILATMKSRGLSKPYPTRVLDPPYRAGDAGFDPVFDSSLPLQHRSTPHAYHNGAVWPFVGGIHVCALFKMKADYAMNELGKLAKGNSVLRSGESVGFNEWIHAKTGRALGQYGQSWSAGMFVAAVLASRGREMLGFLD